MTSSDASALSAFSGAGGLDLGLEAAGFSIVGCIEKDPIARETIRLNRAEWDLLDPPDIVDLASEFSPKDWSIEPGSLDLLAGGPPCQDFSKAAQWSQAGRSGLSGRSGEAIDAFLTLIYELQPRCVFIENVPGFVRGKTNAIPYLERFFEKLNSDKNAHYTVNSEILTASDYGVPQRRERAIIIALKHDISFDWPKPTHAAAPVRAWDALADVDPTHPPEATGKWADLIPTIPEGENYQWHTARGGGRELFGYRTRFWSFLLKLAKNQTSWTLPAQPGPATGPFHWSGRPLSIEERLRLQTFPEDWDLAGSDRDKVRQVGNATPPLLAEIFGKQILDALGYSVSNSSLTYQIERRDSVPDPIDPEPVPERYIDEYEGDHDPHPGAGKGPAPVTE